MYLKWFWILLLMKVKAKVEQEIDYHDQVGIPLAKWIKETEDEIHERLGSGRRITGGDVAPPNSYPYLAGLLIKLPNKTNPSVCGSTVITENRLVTAAHCWKRNTSNADQFTVVLGSQFLYTGGTRIVATNVLVHPSYKIGINEYDVAIILLSTYVTFSETIKPVILPHDSLNCTYEGEWVMTAGYGKTGTKRPLTKYALINHVRLQVISEEQCKLSSPTVKSFHICTNGTGGVGTCRGDSGGPLVSIQQGQPVLVGITSFSKRLCEGGKPSVFERVTCYYDFIMDHL